MVTCLTFFLFSLNYNVAKAVRNVNFLDRLLQNSLQFLIFFTSVRGKMKKGIYFVPDKNKEGICLTRNFKGFPFRDLSQLHLDLRRSVILEALGGDYDFIDCVTFLSSSFHLKCSSTF